jgi:hypothetical protein
MKYEKFLGSFSTAWLRSGVLRIARDSLNNNRDQWSDLSIILKFLNISSVKLVFIGLVESSSIRDLMCWKCSQQLMWALISEFSRSRAMLFKTYVIDSGLFYLCRCFDNPDMKIHIQRGFRIHPVSCLRRALIHAVLRDQGVKLDRCVYWPVCVDLNI